MLPNYLKLKLSKIGINNFQHFSKYTYWQLFKWLKTVYPSLSFKALFDLYCIKHNLVINSLNAQQKQEILIFYKQQLPSYPPLDQSTINYYLDEASEQAKLAHSHQEVPIGAILVYSNQIIGTGFNQTISSKDITLHAEIVALQQAQRNLTNHRLNECDLYVTIEPCLMCVGAILNSRIRRVIFGAIEPKTGAIISQYKTLNNHLVNHHTEAIGPIDNKHYAKLMQQFFSLKR